jgi:hypothetical protein
VFVIGVRVYACFASCTVCPFQIRGASGSMAELHQLGGQARAVLGLADDLKLQAVYTMGMLASFVVSVLLCSVGATLTLAP